MTDPKSSPVLPQALNRALLRAQMEADAWADAASDALGVNRTDFTCLRALYLEGACAAGRLAEITGLTTGAVTGVVDRLERAGFVRRAADPDDRRKVILQVAGERKSALSDVIAGAAMAKVSPEVERFLEGQAATLRRETEKLRAGQSAATVEEGPSGAFSIPFREVVAATFEVVGGAMRLEIECAELADQMLRADLNGPRLRISERDGHIKVAHRTFGLGRPGGRIVLNSRLPWSFRVGGGSNHLSFGLEQATVRGIEIDGGAGDIAMRLGTPAALVPIRINGGASTVSIHRSAAVPAEVVIVRGGATRLIADGADLGKSANRNWASHPGTEPLIRLSARGGVNKLTVGVG